MGEMVLLSEPSVQPGAPDPRPADSVPLVVDLDGTLLRTDTTIESLFDIVRRRPLRLLRLPFWLAGGQARFKRRVAVRTRIDLLALPRNEDLVAHLRELKRQGRRLVLVTGADRRIAQAVAAQTELFDAVLASDDQINLGGSSRRDRLIDEFGEHGFDYAGSRARDLPVWAAARRGLLVRPSDRLASNAARVTTIEQVFGGKRPDWRTYLGEMRIQHWLKNLLLMVPLLAAHRFYEPARLLDAMVGLLSFSLAASGVYVLNDLFDLPSDRGHPHKRNRALASGNIPLLHALVMVPALWLLAASLALSLALPFLGALAVYAALMVVYSVRLKDYAFIDALVLAAGYSLRVYAGSLAVALPVSAWLLVCSTELFFGLALLKRYAELVTLRPELGERGRVRGYGVGDAVLIAAVGTASDCIAVALLALYPVIIEPGTSRVTVWLLSALLLVWTGHMWLMAHRGRIHDDPVAFAWRDAISRGLGIAMAVVLLLAP